MHPELVLDAQAELGEGPSWDTKNTVLYWVDILRGLVHVFEPHESRDTAVRAGKYVSSVVPKRSGGVAITLQHGFYTLNPKEGEVSTIAEVESRLAMNRFNDGKCDLTGRFWAGTMDMEERNASGALYFLERDRVRRVLEDVTISNGLGWSPDNNTMYYIDTPTRKVSALDYDAETGEVKNRRTVVDFNPVQPGSPDGMAVDTEGMIWVAHWGGYRVTRWNPATGRLLDTVILPVALVTSCCFGGRNLDELYITTARTGLDQGALSRQPLSGGLFRVRTGLRGLPTNVFDG
jgi:sugar lactone lactonase YvrE